MAAGKPNLFQFLPHLLLSTPGWGGPSRAAAIDPYFRCGWTAANALCQPGATPGCQPTRAAWKDSSSWRIPACRPCLQVLTPVGLQVRRIRAAQSTANGGLETGRPAKVRWLAKAELACRSQLGGSFAEPDEPSQPLRNAGWLLLVHR